MKDNDFTLAKERSRRYPAQTITDADLADDIAVLVNTLTQAKTLVHAASNIEQILEAAPLKAAAVRPLTTHHENYQS